MTVEEFSELHTESDRSLLAWIVPASLIVHVAAFAILPNRATPHPAPPPPLVIEVADIPAPEPPPPPPPPPEEPKPEPAAPEPQVAPTPQKMAAAPARTESRPTTQAQNDPPPSDEPPADFTGTVMSNDGPGIAVRAGSGGGGTGRGPATGPAPAKADPGPARPAGPRFVAARDLSKPPRAPVGLDGALERNYPTEAKRAGIAGKAVLRVKILPDGRVGGVERVSESYPGFGEACEKTVRSAPWEPPIDREGAPVGTEITYTCRFEVRS
ncbi:Ferric siderophore transport system, periplasmic binding protein TonB [Labilithrix luteola]|uniref:Ferric siderophore transport system, periplasmic binding protein TonB n=2 Tax=Labilithrix luteola TaxID=1391654 RepID=A0A0K1PRB4_9BACT|nr:Ferric siderophore transport system, periplasmic binding protein TonB [Labilithrix luteola]